MNAPHRLRARPGVWRHIVTRGLGGQCCHVCEHDARSGWAFYDAGQESTSSAFVCDACASALAEAS